VDLFTAWDLETVLEYSRLSRLLVEQNDATLQLSESSSW
jgi:hypothetical protein